jgi:dienelactone hydrolase
MPMPRNTLIHSLLALASIAGLLVLSLALQLNLPAPGGAYPVGRTSLAWEDPVRPEPLTEAGDDRRSVAVQIWYPAEAETGSPAPYFPGLERAGAALRESGEVSALEAAGLRLIRSNSFWQAAAAEEGAPFPVLLLSPGNGTNVEFYSGLAEELASQGYLVVGVNHPYDVPAAALADGRVAGYNRAQWELPPRQHQHYVQERGEVRVADALFVLDRLSALNQADPLFAGKLDLERLGFLGHSLGGITAAQTCQRDPRFKACLNLDGIQAGGPFSMFPEPPLLGQPFLFITKEERLHPNLIEQFEALPGRGYVVYLRGASHDHFTDGPLLQPSLLPVETQADRYLEETRRYMVAFFDQELKAEPSSLLEAPHQDERVRVELYP